MELNKLKGAIIEGMKTGPGALKNEDEQVMMPIPLENLSPRWKAEQR